MVSTYVRRLGTFSRDVRLYLIATALSGLTTDGIRAVLLNLYLLRLGYDLQFIGLINAASALSFSLFCLPAGAIGTRWGNRRAILVGISLMVVGHGLLPLVEVVPIGWRTMWLLSTTMLAAIGLALSLVNGLPFLVRATSTEERNHAFSVQMALQPLAGFAGSLVGGVLPGVFASAQDASLDGPAPYRYSLLVAVALLVPAVPVLRSSGLVGAGPRPQSAGKSGPPPWRLMAIMVVIFLFTYAGPTTAFTFFNVYLDTTLGAHTALIGTLSAVARLLSVPAALITPLVLARWGRMRTIMMGSTGIVLSLLLLALIPNWIAAGVGLAGVWILYSVRTIPFRVHSQEVASPEWRPAVSGALMLGAGLGASAMSLGGGYLITGLGYSGLFSVAAGSTVVSALLFWAYFRVPRGELAKQSGREADWLAADAVSAVPNADHPLPEEQHADH